MHVTHLFCVVSLSHRVLLVISLGTNFVLVYKSHRSSIPSDTLSQDSRSAGKINNIGNTPYPAVIDAEEFRDTQLLAAVHVLAERDISRDGNADSARSNHMNESKSRICSQGSGCPKCTNCFFGTSGECINVRSFCRPISLENYTCPHGFTMCGARGLERTPPARVAAFLGAQNNPQHHSNTSKMLSSSQNSQSVHHEHHMHVMQHG